MILNLLTNAIAKVWPMLTIFMVVLIAIRVSYLRINHERFVFYKEFLNLIFVVYVLILFQLLTDAEMNSGLSGTGFNLIPFTEMFRYKVGSSLFYSNVVGNILIFLPFGYFVSGYVKATKISHILFISAISSLTVELVQLQIGRSCDIDDIILNVVGAVAGFLLYIALNAIKKHMPRFLQSDLFYNIICVILCIICIVYFTKIMGLGWF
ncbi:MAG: VanZ family protein [Bacilli bacterium]|nr:VanZ family protein [Bacilli bacterium]